MRKERWQKKTKRGFNESENESPKSKRIKLFILSWITTKEEQEKTEKQTSVLRETIRVCF